MCLYTEWKNRIETRIEKAMHILVFSICSYIAVVIT